MAHCSPTAHRAPVRSGPSLVRYIVELLSCIGGESAGNTMQTHESNNMPTLRNFTTGQDVFLLLCVLYVFVHLLFDSCKLIGDSRITLKVIEL